MQFETSLHTIFILVGPSGCGKSYFSQFFTLKLKEILQINNINDNVQKISSDEIRKMILDNKYMDIDRNDVLMNEASFHAFKILYNYLESVTSFPINAKFVVLDTTGLSKEFRDIVIKIAKKNNYNIEPIVFNYSDVSDYYKYSKNKTVTAKHIKKLRDTVIKEVSREFKKKHYVKTHGLDKIEIKIQDIELYSKCNLDPSNQYIIIGDLHCCIDEFKKMLQIVGFNIIDNLICHTDKTKDIQIISCGDLLDKGTKVKETVEFFHLNLFHNKDVKMYIICGNHDSALEKLLTEKTKEETYADGFIQKYYNSYFELKNDNYLKKKFLEIVGSMVPFLQYISEDSKSRSFYVHHSPNYEKYIGKLDKESIKNQMYAYSDKSKSAYETVQKFINLDSYSFPIVVTGHFAFKTSYNGLKKKNNRLFIDTGCAYGNKLSGVILGNGLDTGRFFSVDFMNLQNKFDEVLYDFSEDNLIKDNLIKDKNNDSEDIYKNLTKEQVYRVKTLLENKVNYISGTMCPANCSSKENCLESLYEAVKYYYDEYKKGTITPHIIIQKKYMGSRCQIYLFKNNLEQSYMVSRNGYTIKSLSKEQIIKIITPLYNHLIKYMTDNNVKMLIVDSEIMPWSLIGKGLIDKHFKTVDYAIGNELSKLEKYGFEEKYFELKDKLKKSDFENDSKKMSKKLLLEKYDHSEFNTFNLFIQENKQHVDIDILKEKHKLYHEQIEIYGKDEEPYLAPFGILKIVYDDGSQEIPCLLSSKIGQIDAHNIVSKDERVILNFENKSFDECIELAQKFYDFVKKSYGEGIVLKPNFNLGPHGVAPYIKVRNPDYLSIIYGYDYSTDEKYKRLMKQKNITRKLKTSVDEYWLGVKMLHVKYDDINVNNTEYAKLLIKFLGLEDIEKEFDPRL